MYDTSPFAPTPLLRNPYLQSMLASAGFRRPRDTAVAAAARKLILTTSAGVRLQGFYSPQPAKPAKGFVLLLHGWEGSEQSTYVLCTAHRLFQNGYAVFRLNLRDHGDSHHLNTGLFFGSLFEEVCDAAAQAAELEPAVPFFMAGYSLGGNYVLRLARSCHANPAFRPRHVVAVSPVLDPERATDRIDRRLMFRKYFLRKWRRSLARKQALFPAQYDFSDIAATPTVYGLTEKLLKRYSPFHNAREYFGTYCLVDGALKPISVDTTIITAADDPIIPIDDFCRLDLSPSTQLIIHPRGGHNGFIEDFSFHAWYERFLMECFAPYNS